MDVLISEAIPMLRSKTKEIRPILSKDDSIYQSRPKVKKHAHFDQEI